MKAAAHFKFGGLNFFFMISHVQTLKGITSRTPDSLHYIFWDIENCTLQQALTALQEVQQKHDLSNIYITSDAPNSFHAFCFNKVPLKKMISIIADTAYVDYSFLKWTVQRQCATIRISPKKDRPKQKLLAVLESYPVPIPEIVQPVIYDTGLQKRGNLLIFNNGKLTYQRC